jgi:hypothetical protein
VASCRCSWARAYAGTCAGRRCEPRWQANGGPGGVAGTWRLAAAQGQQTGVPGHRLGGSSARRYL